MLIGLEKIGLAVWAPSMVVAVFLVLGRLRGKNIREVEAEVIRLRPPPEEVEEESAGQPEAVAAPEIAPEALPEPEETEDAEDLIPELEWEETEPPAPEPAAPPPVPEPRISVAAARAEVSTEQLCEIAFWRGYLKAGFYARAFDEEGEEVAVGESSLFRSHGNGIPDQTEKAVEAYEALVEQLKREGWKPLRRGETWFGSVFRLELTTSAESEQD